MSVKLISVLGEGNFGKVWKAEWLDRIIAAKAPKAQADPNWKKAFLDECQIVQSLKHPNIISVYSVVEERGHPYLLMEYAPKGSLLTLVQKIPVYEKNNIRRTLYKMAADIADAMAYLQANKVVHRDLAARNILVMSDYTCKISDFGLTRNLLKYSNVLQQSVGYQRYTILTQEYAYVRSNPDGPFPIRWTAPEAFYGSATSQSDVWSFGIVLWEMLTFGRSPYDGIANEALHDILIASPYNRLEKPQGCLEELYSIMMATWAIEPLQRPVFALIRDRLMEIIRLLAAAEAQMMPPVRPRVAWSGVSHPRAATPSWPQQLGGGFVVPFSSRSSSRMLSTPAPFPIQTQAGAFPSDFVWF
eukprot:scpid80205/ scgid28838/ Tyrosine-protein kinase Fer; Proto-oncogene c-Fer; p94-Fer